MQDPRYRERSKQDVHLHRPRASHLQQRVHDDDDGHILGKVPMRADRAPEVAIVAIPESDLVTAAVSRDPKAQERVEQPERAKIARGDRRHGHCFPPLKGPTTSSIQGSVVGCGRAYRDRTSTHVMTTGYTSLSLRRQPFSPSEGLAPVFEPPPLSLPVGICPDSQLNVGLGSRGGMPAVPPARRK